MYPNNDKISSPQIFHTLLLMLIGVGILNLPRNLAETVGTDAWIVLLVGGVLTAALAFVFGYIVKSFPEKRYIDILTSTLTKPVAYVIVIVTIFYLLLLNGFVLRIFGDVVKLLLLPKTPIEVILLGMIFVVAYGTRKGMEPMARLAEILFPLIVIPTVFLFILALVDADFSNVLPSFQISVKDIMTALPVVFFSFSGIEILPIFGIFLAKPKEAPKVAPLAVGGVLVFYLLLVVATISKLGIYQSQHLVWPTISLFKTIEFPGAFIENVEAIVMTLWVLTVFTTMAPGYIGSTILLADVMGAKEHSFFAFPLIPVSYFLALYMDSLPDVYTHLDRAITYLAVFIALILPALILLSMAIQKMIRKEGSSNG